MKKLSFKKMEVLKGGGRTGECLVNAAGIMLATSTFAPGPSLAFGIGSYLACRFL